MKTIEYATDGLAIADALCEEQAREFLKNPSIDYIKISVHCFIDAVRVCIHEGLVDCSQVRFLFNGEELTIDSYGRMENWPFGFCDVNECLLARLLAPKASK